MERHKIPAVYVRWSVGLFITLLSRLLIILYSDHLQYDIFGPFWGGPMTSMKVCGFDLFVTYIWRSATILRLVNVILSTQYIESTSIWDHCCTLWVRYFFMYTENKSIYRECVEYQEKTNFDLFGIADMKQECLIELLWVIITVQLSNHLIHLMARSWPPEFNIITRTTLWKLQNCT